MSQFLLAFYLLISAALIFLSLNCYVMFFLFRRRLHKKRQEALEFEIKEDYPTVTTQIAIFNELNVAERIINAVVSLEYPVGKHHIQVVDDSTDETYDIVRALVKKKKLEGIQIEHLHRTHRQGYKAGALAEAVEKCQTDYVALFDADFVPHKDYLLKTMPHFQRGQKVGLVQCRWGHINRNESLITRVQALGIDGHFAVEQSARDWNDLYMNFNGTAGVMSLAAIKDAGGWSADTLTEDMDLSYRMQLAGWKTHYLLDVECPAELPSDMNAFKSQQFRWAKGSMQTALKIIPKVFKDPAAGLFKKYQAVMHMTHYMIHPLMLLTAVLSWPLAASYGYTADSKNMMWLYLSLFICFSAPSLIYISSQKVLFRDWYKNLICYPALMFIGSGLCLSNSRAVWEALTGKVSGFVRTPKKGDKETKHYTVKIPFLPFMEVGLGIYCSFSLAYFMAYQQWLASFFVGIYAMGFLFNGLLSLLHNHFFKELFFSLRSRYGAALIALVGCSYFLGMTNSGTTWFIVFYLLIGVLMLVAWKYSPQEMSSGHVYILFLASFLSRYFMFSFEASDDVYRYIWEGRALAHGFDPYVLAPDSSFLIHLRDSIWLGINHQDWTAIYGPFVLILFEFFGEISATVEFFKLMIVAFDVAVIFILYWIVTNRGLALKNLLFYAVNPLVLVVFVGEGHLDAIQVFLLMSAFLCREKKFWLASAVFLGLAIGVKVTGLLFLPFLVRRENWKSIFVVLGAVALPILYFDASFQQMFSSIIRFGAEMSFNASFYSIFLSVVGGSGAHLLCVFLVLSFAVGYWLTQDNLYKGALFTYFVFLLLVPTLHPWYMIIAIALAVVVKSSVLVAWSLSAVFYFNVYFRLRSSGEFSHSLADQFLQYMPILGMALYLAFKKIRGQKVDGAQVVESTVSVLIPVLNEVESISAIVNDLKAQTVKPHEVIVIDGGSEDGTLKALDGMGVELLSCSEKGRGNQLCDGLEKATGDIVLILHADKRLSPSLIHKVASACDADKELIGGALGAKFESNEIKYRVIEFLNNLRMAICGISFGDQGQFFRRELALKYGLVKRIPLMEDIELAMGLQDFGKVAKLDGGLEVSIRRWRQKNVFGNALQIFILLFKYLFLRRLRLEVKADKFYEEYYLEKPYLKKT